MAIRVEVTFRYAVRAVFTGKRRRCCINAAFAPAKSIFRAGPETRDDQRRRQDNIALAALRLQPLHAQV